MSQTVTAGYPTGRGSYLRPYDGVALSSLPDWPYAGKRLDEIVYPRSAVRRDGERQIISLPHRNISTSVHSAGQEEVTKRDYVVSYVRGLTGRREYLIPLYPERETSYQRREERLLGKRVSRFFYSAKSGIDVPRTKEQLEAEFDAFQKKLEQVNNDRASQGLPEIDPFTPRDELTAAERQLLIEGEAVTGHAVNRLGRLGSIILQNDRHGIDIEFSDAFIARSMDAIKEEFGNIYTRLIVLGPMPAQCVRTRDEKPDYDGVFTDLIREMGKPVLGSLSDRKIDEFARPPEEAQIRNHIVHKMGDALDAIDQTYDALLQITQSRYFSDPKDLTKDADKRESLVGKVAGSRELHLDYINSRLLILQAMEENPLGFNNDEKRRELASLRREKAKLERTSKNDVDIKNYRGLLREFRDVCRARACIRGDDGDNFPIVASRFEQLAEELGLIHQTMFENTTRKTDEDKHEVDENIEATARLLKRGVGLMYEMAELRMPRNHSMDVKFRGNSFTKMDEQHREIVDEQKLLAFYETDPSSVGRLRRDIEAHLDIVEPHRTMMIGTNPQPPSRGR